MSANSKHFGDINLWIEKVIDSCITPLQESSALHLIQNFEKILLNKGKGDDYRFYSMNLRDKLGNHRSLKNL
jgi:hypothetical protein